MCEILLILIKGNELARHHSTSRNFAWSYCLVNCMLWMSSIRHYIRNWVLMYGGIIRNCWHVNFLVKSCDVTKSSQHSLLDANTGSKSASKTSISRDYIRVQSICYSFQSWLFHFFDEYAFLSSSVGLLKLLTDCHYHIIWQTVLNHYNCLKKEFLTQLLVESVHDCIMYWKMRLIVIDQCNLLIGFYWRYCPVDVLICNYLELLCWWNDKVCFSHFFSTRMYASENYYIKCACSWIDFVFLVTI